MYETDPGTGFRINCLCALAALVRTADEGQGALPALDLLRTVTLESENAALASAACLAYCRWPGAVADGEVVAALPTRIQASVGDERKRYLRALAALDAPLDTETSALIEAIAEAEDTPASHRKIATAILTANGGGV